MGYLLTASFSARRFSSGHRGDMEHPGPTMKARPPVWVMASRTSCATASGGPFKSVSRLTPPISGVWRPVYCFSSFVGWVKPTFWL